MKFCIFLIIFIVINYVEAYISKCGQCICEYRKTMKEAICVGLGMDRVPLSLPKWIERLTLDDNMISEIDVQYIASTYSKLKFISMRENPICLEQSVTERVRLMLMYIN